jgi:hypothetical protein
MKAQPAQNAGRAHYLANRLNAGSLFQIAALVVLMASAAAAQFGGGFGPRFVPAKYPNADTFGHGFVFCRGIYRSDRREAGGTGWSTDYPDAELNFSIRLSELTKARVTKEPDGKPVHVTCTLPCALPTTRCSSVRTSTWKTWARWRSATRKC